MSYRIKYLNTLSKLNSATKDNGPETEGSITSAFLPRTESKTRNKSLLLYSLSANVLKWFLIGPVMEIE